MAVPRDVVVGFGIAMNRVTLGFLDQGRQMESEVELEKELLLQPVKPGTVIPENFPSTRLFLLNFTKFIEDEIWDDFGQKELSQSGQLREFALRIIAIADAMESLGCVLQGWPDANDFDLEEDIEIETWVETKDEMEAVRTDGYKNLISLVDELEEGATGDFIE